MTDMSAINEKFIFILKVFGAIWLFASSKKIFGIIRESFGHIDKQELAGMIFTPVLIWMLWGEHGREHEWQIYSEFKFATVALIVIYGFGLRKVLNYFLLIKGIDPKSIDKDDKEDA